ncbi:hypothetical protein HELRODRAFT_191441 [Helobdella robusta]|uniref:snRNA-activating protein complex subunit 4 n=1 Tax=Helobdella robusta TaxID=6412 RepID=T1FSZ7_HELRO|nr:hypothetical protein HELRODRAFT_191441 [Helobdella robusta]ESO05314.1 hypothetical protein HELRODRAFT_191441 [Helobdella robusta]
MVLVFEYYSSTNFKNLYLTSKYSYLYLKFSKYHMQESTKPLEVCLALNRQFQTWINNYISKVTLILDKNRAHQEQVKNDFEELASQKHLQKKKGFSVFAKPYFRDIHGSYPQPNEDTLKKVSTDELYSFIKPSKTWSVEEKNILEQSVRDFRMKKSLKPHMNKKQLIFEKLNSYAPGSEEEANLNKKMAEIDKEIDRIKSSTQSLLKFADLEELEDIDWVKISNVDLKGTKTPEACMSFWKNAGHPSINTCKWTSREDDNLSTLAKQNKLRNWKRVSDQLGTNRTAFMCLQRYQSKFNPVFQIKWTVTEDRRLEVLINSQLSALPHVDWSAISAEFGSKSEEECIYRWEYLQKRLKHRGKWTKDLEKKLTDAVKLFGMNWKKVQYFVPKKNYIQCRDRYMNNLCGNLKRGKWTPKEDKLLWKAVKQLGLDVPRPVHSKLRNKMTRSRRMKKRSVETDEDEKEEDDDDEDYWNDFSFKFNFNDNDEDDEDVEDMNEAANSNNNGGSNKRISTHKYELRHKKLKIDHSAYMTNDDDDFDFERDVQTDANGTPPVDNSNAFTNIGSNDDADDDLAGEPMLGIVKCEDGTSLWTCANIERYIYDEGSSSTNSSNFLRRNINDSVDISDNIEMQIVNIKDNEVSGDEYVGRFGNALLGEAEMPHEYADHIKRQDVLLERLIEKQLFATINSFSKAGKETSSEYGLQQTKKDNFNVHIKKKFENLINASLKLKDIGSSAPPRTSCVVRNDSAHPHSSSSTNFVPVLPPLPPNLTTLQAFTNLLNHRNALVMKAGLLQFPSKQPLPIPWKRTQFEDVVNSARLTQILEDASYVFNDESDSVDEFSVKIECLSNVEDDDSSNKTFCEYANDDGNVSNINVTNRSSSSNANHNYSSGSSMNSENISSCHPTNCFNARYTENVTSANTGDGDGDNNFDSYVEVLRGRRTRTRNDDIVNTHEEACTLYELINESEQFQQLQSRFNSMFLWPLMCAYSSRPGVVRRVWKCGPLDPYSGDDV